MEKVKLPLVSVIVVTYNSSEYVLETLESVKNQTWQNVELIVTDDCSVDNTVQICTDWVENNKERFFRSEIISNVINTGIPSNCNRGVKNSHGKWIKLIAGDDMLIESCIQSNMQYIDQNPEARFIVSELLEIDDDGLLINNEVEKRKKDNWLKLFFNAKTAGKQLKTYARYPAFINAPTFFINKQLLNDIDFFDEDYRIFEDMPLIYRVNSNDTLINFMNKPTVKYRIHDRAISRKVSINSIRDKEVISVFKKYRKGNLSKFNLIDLSIYYEMWLYYYWKGIGGYKGTRLLGKLSLFHWYVKFITFKVG